MERRSIGRIALAVLAGAVSLGAYSDDVARGDAAWLGRAENVLEGRALPAPISEAIRSYESALVARPQSIEARWKLLRALHFAGDFVPGDEAEKRGLFERAREISEDGVELLADRTDIDSDLDRLPSDAIVARLERVGIGPSNVARFYFWSAINWGAWSRQAGLLRAVRQGVANRIHRHVLVTIALEPDYDDGGAYRLLGRLHAELPRVPFVSGWVDRDQSVPLIERAYAISPENPGNRLLLALTLLDLSPGRRPEALELLEQVGTLRPRPTMYVEDLAMRREARARLADERAFEQM